MSSCRDPEHTWHVATEHRPLHAALQAQLPGWQQWLQLLGWAQRNHGYAARASCQLEVCSTGALLPAHYELRDRLLLQVGG
jgi:hypothetical protein